MAYFQKIEQSDIFVLLGQVQYKAGNYQNRFRSESNWFTMSVHRGMNPIKEKKYSNPFADWTTIKKSYPNLEIFDAHVSQNLWITNCGIIKEAAQLLGIKHDIVTDYETHLMGTNRLIDICKTYGADKYLSGISGKKYLDLELFKMAEIEVIFQEEKDMDKRPLVELL
jgi:hypothetical protein